MTRLLDGHAADAALRLLPPDVRRQVQVLATLRDIPVRRSLRVLVHIHHGDIDAYRQATIEQLVVEARSGQLQRGPGLRTWREMVQGKDTAGAAQTVVEGLLISKDTPFATYREDVELALHGRLP